MDGFLPHDRLLFTKSRSDEFVNASSPEEHRGPKAKVVLIDTRRLISTILLDALKDADAISDYVLFPSAASWLASTQPDERCTVLLSVDSQPGRTLDCCVSDLKLLVRDRPETKVIVLSSDENPEAVCNALDIGAVGYASTSLSVQAVLHVIQLVQAGDRYIPPASFQALVRRSSKTEKQPERESLLSPRETMIAQALRKGTPNKVIAYDLGMCESTVKVHVRSIMKKLKAKNRTQVAFLTNTLFADQKIELWGE